MEVDVFRLEFGVWEVSGREHALFRGASVRTEVEEVPRVLYCDLKHCCPSLSKQIHIGFTFTQCCAGTSFLSASSVRSPP